MNQRKRSWLRNFLVGSVLVVCCCVTFAEMEWASPKGVERFTYNPAPITSLSSLAGDGWVAEDLSVDNESFRSIRRIGTNSKKWILFLPGNGESQLASVKEGFNSFEDVSVLGVAYPGFDSAPNRPSRDSIMRTGELALSWIRQNYAPDEIHVVGFSLGSCVALHLAAKHPLTTLSILGTFKPIDIIKDRRYLFRRWANAERFDTFKLARNASAKEPKVIFIHGRDDSVVSAKDAEQVARVLDVQLKLAEAGHGDLLNNAQTQIWLRGFVSPQ